MRLKPSFYIIGERKCGTSSLFRYTCDHPFVLPGKLKEPNFFTQDESHIQQNIENYWKLFPDPQKKTSVFLTWPELDAAGILKEQKISYPIDLDRTYITGEASANTFQLADPQIIKKHLPDVRFILLLRDPVARSFSHYRMFTRFEKEGRNLTFTLKSTFAEHIRYEIERISKGLTAPVVGPSLYSNSFLNWEESLQSNQLLVIDFHDLVHRPRAMYSELCKFLELEPCDIVFSSYNVAPKANIGLEIKEKLRDFFLPYDLKLAEFLGRKLSWMLN